MAKNAKVKMDLNEAVTILQGEAIAKAKGTDGYSAAEVKEALKIVQTQDPDNQVLHVYNEQAKNAKKTAAKAKTKTNAKAAADKAAPKAEGKQTKSAEKSTKLRSDANNKPAKPRATKGVKKPAATRSKNDAAKMDLDEAVTVLQGEAIAKAKGTEGFSKAQVDEALKIVQEQAPDNKVLSIYMQQAQNAEKAENRAAKNENPVEKKSENKLENVSAQNADAPKVLRPIPPAESMSLEEAVAILQGETLAAINGADGFSQSKIQEALKIIQDKDPNHPALKAYQEQLANFEKANKLQSNNPVVYAQNSEDTDFTLRGYTFDKFTESSENDDIREYVDNTELTDSVSGKVLEGQERKDYLNLIFEGAKLKTETSLTGDEEFAKLSHAEKIKTVKAELKTIFFADFARTAIASDLEKPTTLEQRIGSKEYKDYILRQSQKASGIMQKIVSGGQKIKIKTDAILASCADTAAQTEQYIKGLRLKAQQAVAQAAQSAKNGVQKASDNVRNDFNKIADRLQKRKNNFEQLANNISKNRYQIFKNIKGSFSDNKIKLFGNVAANAAFGYVTAAAASGAVAGAAAPVLVPAVAAYAVYHAAGSWVYPVVAEIRKINRQKREAGEATLPFKQALKQAWKNKTESRKNRRTYIVSGLINTAVAAGGFAWLKDGLEAADAASALTDGVKDGLNVTLASSIAETRHAISMGRAGAATMAQLADAGVAYGVSVADPQNLEKKAEAKQTAIAALVGMGLNAAAQGLSSALQGSGNAETSDVLSSDNGTPAPVDNPVNNDGVVNPVVGAPANNPEVNDVDPAPSAGDNVSDIADTTNDASVAPKPNFVKGLWNKWFGGRNNDETPSTPIVGDGRNPDGSLQLSDGNGDAINIVDNGGNAGDVATNDGDVPAGLFPREYNQDMGISQREYNTLVNTTEGTLKAATGEEVTLDRAYSNLSGSMEQFNGRTEEEIMYKYNRLYAFMRKAYSVGDGTLRETPSGSEYLTSRFSNINLPGMNEDKMSQLVDFAKDNTYANKAELKEGLNKLFPEGLSNKDMTALITTIHSNQRFNQYQSEMEALTKLLGCGEKISDEQALAINKMLDNTDALLATGKAHTQLTGLSLAKDCNDDDGEWRRVAVQPKEVPLPETPDLGDAELPNDEIVIDDTPQMQLQPDEGLQVEPIAAPTEQPQDGVEKIVGDKMSQVRGENEPDYRKPVSDRKAARLLKRINSGSRE